MTSLIWSIFIVVILAFTIIVFGLFIIFNRDKKEKQDYIDYLKTQIDKLKYKQQDSDVPCKDTGIQLFKETIDYISTRFHSKFGHDIIEDEEFIKTNSTTEKEKAIMIAGYKTLIAELNGLENSRDPAEVWQKIQKCLSILIVDTSGEAPPVDLSEQLKTARQRIENLEKFKQLYFDLQEKMAANITLGEAFNAEVIENLSQNENSEQLIKLLEKHNTHYIEMGKMADMDKEKHHYSVQYLDAYTEHYLNERKSEIKRLKSQVAHQFEEIWHLQTALSSQTAPQSSTDDASSMSETIARQFKDAELCIETMDLEIKSLTSELANAKNELDQQRLSKQEEAFARFAQESKEMMTCITGLEDSNFEKSNIIKELENKCARLETDYTDMENKYLDVVNH